jgi:hypothetical protein
MADFIIGKDIFKEPGDLYVVTVNTQGVMGAGVAKAFAERHPDLMAKYKHDCKYRIITIGNCALYKGDDGKHYLMFPTKEQWRNNSTYDYVAAGLHWMATNIGEEGGIDPKWKIVMPPLGCGNGKLSFDIVQEMIEEMSKHIPNQVVCVYPPWMIAVE